MLILRLRGKSGVGAMSSDTKSTGNQVEVAKQHRLCGRKEELRQKETRKLWEEMFKVSQRKQCIQNK